MKEYNIQDIQEIATAIKSGDPVENDIGTVIDGFFWFPDEMRWAAEWQKEEEQDSPNTYFAMLLDPDVFKDTEDDDEIMAGIEYWWHRSQIYSAAYLVNQRTVIESRFTENLAQQSLQDLLQMQTEVRDAFKDMGMEMGADAKPHDVWMVVRTTAQNIHNSVRGIH